MRGQLVDRGAFLRVGEAVGERQRHDRADAVGFHEVCPGRLCLCRDVGGGDGGLARLADAGAAGIKGGGAALCLLRQIGGAMGKGRRTGAVERRDQRIPASVMAGEVLRRHLARMADTKREDETGKRDIPFILNGLEEVRDRFLAEPVAVLQFGQVCAVAVGKGEDIHRLPDRQGVVVKEHLDLFRAQPLDVESGAGDEMFQLFNGLRGADQPAGAAPHRVAFLAHGIGPAFRAGHGEVVRHRVAGPLRQVHIGHLRDHVARAIDLHPVADADILAAPDLLSAGRPPGDVILIMQGRVRHDDPADRHRHQPRDGRQRAGAADLNVDRLEPGPGQFGGKLVRDGPAGGGGAEAEPGLQVKRVDLVDHPVDVIAERRAALFDPAILVQHLRRSGAKAGQRVGLKAKRGKPVDGAHLRVGKRGRQFAPGIGKKAQRSPGGDRGIQLTQRSGGGVARVGEGLGALLRLPRVQGREIGMAHIDLAAHLKHLRRAAQRGGNIGDGPGVGGDVFPRLAIAACRRLHQPPAFIAQGQRQPVDLRFRRIGQRRTRAEAEEIADALVEGRDLIGVEGIGEAQHRDRVAGLGEGLGRRGADLVAGAVIGLEIGEARLDRQQTAFQRVIGSVRNFRRVLGVVGAVGLPYGAGQGGHLPGGRRVGQGRDVRTFGHGGRSPSGRPDSDNVAHPACPEAGQLAKPQPDKAWRGPAKGRRQAGGVEGIGALDPPAGEGAGQFAVLQPAR